MLARFVVSHVATLLTAVAGFLVALRLLSTRRSPQSLLAWLLAIAFLPFVAIPLYLLIGGRKLPQKTRPVFAPGDEPLGDVERVLRADGAPPARVGHTFDLIGDGVAAFARLCEEIRAAHRQIDVTVFILGNDATGHALIAALAERARSGVAVRLLLDAVGSRRVARRATREIGAAGGEVRLFMPLLHVPLRGRTNLRSHRKLAIFDDARVFLGGMNAAMEYMGKEPDARRWRDVAAVVDGPVAKDALALFESDWLFAGGTPRAAPSGAPSREGGARVQLVPSGPDMSSDTFYDALLVALYGARERIAAVTPYYVPDDAVQHALVLAARRGVAVELVMPARSNHTFADFARRGLVRDLRAAGVSLRWHPQMVHAKAVAIDDTFAYVGSPNLDMRSFFLNYEDALVVHSADEVGVVRAFLETLAAECTAPEPRLGAERWLLEQVARIIAPEL